MKIAVCDDDLYYRNHIKKMTETFLQERNVAFHLDVFSSGEEFFRFSGNLIEYNVVLLDIGMKEMTGMEVAHRIKEEHAETQIVFITVMLEYAPEGYMIPAFRYIMKDKLAQLLPECLSEILKGYKNRMQMMEFPFIGGHRKIILGNLFYIESRLHRLEFTCNNGTFYMYGKLSVLEHQLAEYNFVRVHQSFLVNLAHVVMLKRYQIELLNGKEIPVSKQRYSFVDECFIHYKEKM